MAKDNGFLWGAYNFATSDEPKTAALDFIHVAAPDDKTLMCLDFEDNPGHQMSGDQAFVFLDTMIQKLGRKVWIYGGNTIKERISPHAGEQRWKDMANNVHLWRPRFLNSHFENSTELFKAVGTLAPWEKLTMVQYAADGSGPQPHTVPGLENSADLNATIMTADELRAMWPG